MEIRSLSESKHRKTQQTKSMGTFFGLKNKLKKKLRFLTSHFIFPLSNSNSQADFLTSLPSKVGGKFRQSKRTNMLTALDSFFRIRTNGKMYARHKAPDSQYTPEIHRSTCICFAKQKEKMKNPHTILILRAKDYFRHCLILLPSFLTRYQI